MDSTETSDIQNLLHNITFLRKHHNLSKKKMARLLHIGIPTLNKIEIGVLPDRLSAEVLVYLANYFGYTTDDLLFRWLEE